MKKVNGEKEKFKYSKGDFIVAMPKKYLEIVYKTVYSNLFPGKRSKNFAPYSIHLLISINSLHNAVWTVMV